MDRTVTLTVKRIKFPHQFLFDRIHVLFNSFLKSASYWKLEWSRSQMSTFPYLTNSSSNNFTFITGIQIGGSRCFFSCGFIQWKRYICWESWISDIEQMRLNAQIAHSTMLHLWMQQYNVIQVGQQYLSRNQWTHESGYIWAVMTEPELSYCKIQTTISKTGCGGTVGQHLPRMNLEPPQNETEIS